MTVTIYSTKVCGDCTRAKHWLDQRHIAYKEIIIDGDEKLTEYVRSMSNGERTVPVLIFPDKSYLAEPTNEELAKKVGELKRL